MSQSSMSRSRRSFSPEFKDELCREVIDSSKPISENAYRNRSFHFIVRNDMKLDAAPDPTPWSRVVG